MTEREKTDIETSKDSNWFPLVLSAVPLIGIIVAAWFVFVPTRDKNLDDQLDAAKEYAEVLKEANLKQEQMLNELKEEKPPPVPQSKEAALAPQDDTSTNVEQAIDAAKEAIRELNAIQKEQERILKELNVAKTPAEIEKLRKESEAIKKRLAEATQKATFFLK
jgi:Xaa-Pro aminopeptidase